MGQIVHELKLALFFTVCEVSERLVKTLDAESSVAVDNVIEIKDLSARFTTDVIGSCGFGLETNSLQDPKNEFRDKMRRFFTIVLFIRYYNLLTITKVL